MSNETSYSAAERLNVFTLHNVQSKFIKIFRDSKKKGPFPKILFGRNNLILCLVE